MPDHLTLAMFGGLSINAVGRYIVRNGRVGYDAVLFHDRTALWSVAPNHGEDYVRSAITRAAPAGGLPTRQIGGSAACIHGAGYTVYGHWLVDFLPRLYVLARAGYDIFKLRYVLPYDSPRFALEFLQLIGISPQQLVAYDPVREQVQFDELVVPTNLRNGSRLYRLFAEATRAWVNRVLPEDGPARPARCLFVSRAHVRSDRTLGNRALIERMAEAAGFTIVHPEASTLADQVALFRSARQIVGEYGSALHGTIYGAGALHCCALRGTSHSPGFIQSSLAQAFGQTMSYVFGPADAGAINYSFDINPDDFRRALACLEVELAGA